MGQIRFQVGIPKAGSAARSAEQEPRSRSLSSLAGSAARVAEEAKRTAGSSGFQGAPTISMRAAGGKVFQPPAERESVAAASSLPIDVVAAPQAMMPVSEVSAITPAEESNQPGALQTAVSRVHSLVQSLFGGRTRTP